jgi:hypothetical protein
MLPHLCFHGRRRCVLRRLSKYVCLGFPKGTQTLWVRLQLLRLYRKGPKDDPPPNRERGEEVDRYGRAYNRYSRSHHHDERGEDRYWERSPHDDSGRSLDRSPSLDEDQVVGIGNMNEADGSRGSRRGSLRNAF